MLEDVDESACLLIAPIEFMFKPIAPRAAELPYDLFALGQAAANLDHVLDGLPAKMVDRRGVTGQGQVVVGTCGRAVGSVTGHPIVLLGFADRENEKREAPVSWPGLSHVRRRRLWRLLRRSLQRLPLQRLLACASTRRRLRR